MDKKPPGSFIQNIFVPLISVGTAAMVAWLNYSVSQVDQDLKARITAVDISVKEAKDERERLNAEREFNFRIYELVQQSIEEKNERKQEVARQFVLVMVDGELRRRLLGVLEVGGTDNIRAEVASVMQQEQAFESEQAQIFTIQRLNRPSPDKWKNWDYDMFWCSSSGPEAKKQAQMIKQQLESEGASGRLRVRELPDSINAKPDYQVSGYAIMRSDNELEQSNRFQQLSEDVLAANGFAVKFVQRDTSPATKWYISAFICP